MKQTVGQKTQGVVKTVIQKLILNISIYAIFISLAVVVLAYAGLDFNISTSLVMKVAVPSVLLCISNLIIYELWLRNGAANARNEQEYKDLLMNYSNESKDINEDIMQEFLDAEYNRRYKVEEDKINTLINKCEKQSEYLNKQLADKPKTIVIKARLVYNTKLIKKLYKHLDNISVDMPYSKSEEFDQLRYTANDAKYKEYKPNDTAKFLTKHRIKKYAMLITGCLVGINILSISLNGSNWLIAIFMGVLAAISLISSLVMGFSNGYNSISISSVGVYKTGLSFIEKAKAYCNKNNKQLYYTISKKAPDEIPESMPKLENTIETKLNPFAKLDMDIFNKNDRKAT